MASNKPSEAQPAPAQSWKVELMKQHTTVTDMVALNQALTAAKLSLTAVLNRLKLQNNAAQRGHQVVFNELVAELQTKIKAAGFENYNVVVGEDFTSALRYEKASLITIRWDKAKILLFRCPANPLFSLEEVPAVQHSDSNVLAEKYCPRLG